MGRKKLSRAVETRGLVVGRSEVMDAGVMVDGLGGDWGGAGAETGVGAGGGVGAGASTFFSTTGFGASGVGIRGIGGAAASTFLGLGEAGRLVVGVKEAPPGVVAFFDFFLRLVMASCTGSFFVGWTLSSSRRISSSICLALSCRSFFCWFFVLVRAGADPTMLLKGGGELARENDVDVTETLSEICSLDGVPGGFIEAILGCLDGNLVVTFGMAVAALGMGGGVSVVVVGVATTRNVLGAAAAVAAAVAAAFLTDESFDMVGLTGRDSGAIEPARERRPCGSILTGVD